MLLGGLTGCSEKPGTPSTDPSKSTAESITNYPARGVILAVEADKKRVQVKHEEIVGYMPAMSMPFEVRDTNELRGLSAGQRVTFRLRVTGTDGWIDQLRVIEPTAWSSAADPKSQGANSKDNAIRVLPNVPTLNVGDRLPDYGFTNHLGQPFHLSDFKGSAYAFTFIFTRCPFPNFCPRITDHFTQVQTQLKERKGGPDQWRLLSITLDPEYDTDAILSAYGNRAHADSTRWWMARGSYDTLDRISGHFGQYYAQGASVAGQNHNLRTVVVDPTGRVSQIFIGNEWTVSELTQAMIEAAAKR